MAIIISCCCTWNIRRTHSKKWQLHKKRIKGNKSFAIELFIIMNALFAVHRTIQHPNCCNETNNQNVFKLWVHFNHFIWKNFMRWTVWCLVYCCYRHQYFDSINYLFRFRISFLKYLGFPVLHFLLFLFLFFHFIDIWRTNENVKRRTFEIVQLMPFGYDTTTISARYCVYMYVVMQWLENSHCSIIY